MIAYTLSVFISFSSPKSDRLTSMSQNTLFQRIILPGLVMQSVLIARQGTPA